MVITGVRRFLVSDECLQDAVLKWYKLESVDMPDFSLMAVPEDFKCKRM
jgi:hypothetical protein